MEKQWYMYTVFILLHVVLYLGNGGLLIPNIITSLVVSKLAGNVFYSFAGTLPYAGLQRFLGVFS
jgi:hypothetical protein